MSIKQSASLPLGSAPPEADEAGFQAWMTVVHAFSLVSKTLDRELIDAHGVSLAWFEVLARLHRRPEGRLRMQELSQSLVVSKASVTKLIDRMELAGLVRRQTATDDRRVTYAVITDTGRITLAAALPTQIGNIRRHFAQFLSEEELNTLRALLEKVVSGQATLGGQSG
ncbi:MarR family transcriptional regulator [Kitasatospora sp. NPDC097605]|uniref:MarR family winged helix-turn-helix transcriptional regulator n=1 Tax=Kitasatospora sp. NPDC097605 TaxID=3157226 RepID=UPI0033327A6F